MKIEMQLPAPSEKRLTARELRAQELVHAFGNSACNMIEWIRHAEADAQTRHEALKRIFDVAEIHFEKHRRENGL